MIDMRFLRITRISNPRRAVAGLIDVTLDIRDLGTIDCSLCRFDGAEYRLGGEPITNGELYERAERGEFGEVAGAA